MYFERIKPNYSGYQELHVHTVGSFRDAVNTVSDVFDAAEELGYNAVAITDHGNWTRLFEALKERTKREKKSLEKALRFHSVPDDEINAVLKTIGPFDSLRNPNDKMKPYIEKYEDAFVEAVKNSIQFVPGIEMYEGDEESPDKYHLILYAKDWIGAKELFKLNNLAQLNKYRELPRTTRAQLKRFFGEGKPGHGHIIMTSACVAGRIPSILLKKFYAQEEINEYRRKLDEKRVYPQYEVDDARARYEDLEADYSAKREDLAAMKKIANRKFASTLKKAQTAYDNAVKINSEDLSLRAEELKTIIAQKEETEAVQKLIPGTEKEVAALKDLLKDAKDHLKKLQSANAPADRLEKMGAHFLIMPCNTAHYFLPRFKDKLHVPFFSIIEEAARYCHKKEVKCVALLATEGTLAAGIYDEAMSKYDIQLIKPDMDQRKVCQDIIYNGVKAGNKDYDTTAFCNVLKDLRAKGAEHFILGCTETPIAVEMYHIKESFIDPTDIIARRAVEFARTGK